MKTYEVQMKDKKGDWKVWGRYEDEAMGMTTRERAEAGLKIARCYGECRIIEK